MDGPRPISETYGTNQFRNDLAEILDMVRLTSRVVLIENQRRMAPMAVVISPELWQALGRMKLEVTGMSHHPDGTGGYLTRTELATKLHAAAAELGGETYQLTAGETTAVRGLLTELASRHPDEPLGQLAEEWADRLGTRTAPSL